MCYLRRSTLGVTKYVSIFKSLVKFYTMQAACQLRGKWRGGGGEKHKREYKTPQYKSNLLTLMEEKYIVVLQWERSKMIESHKHCPRCCTIHGSYGVHNKWLLFMKYCLGHRGQGSKGCFIQGNKDCSRRSDTQSPLVFPPNDLNWSPPSEQCVYDPNTWNRLKDIRCASLLCMSSHSFCRAAECSSGTMGSRKL